MGIIATWALAYTFRDKLKASFVQILNAQLIAEVGVGDITLNYTDYFPRLAVQFSDVLIMDPQSGPTDTLLSARTVAFTFNPLGLLRRSVIIDEIALEEGMTNLRLNARSQPNYKIWKSSETPSASSDVSLNLNRISLVQMEIDYTDLATRNRFALLASDVQLQFQRDVEIWGIQSNGPVQWRNLQLSGTSYSLDEVMDHAVALQWAPTGWQLETGRLIRRGSYIEASGAYLEDSQYRFQIRANKLSLERWLGKSLEWGDALQGYSSIEGHVHNESGFPVVELHFEVEDGAYQPEAGSGSGSVRNIAAKGSFLGSLEDKSSLILRIDAFSGQVEGQPCAGSLLLEDFVRPRVSAQFQGQIALAFLNLQFPSQSLHWESGYIDATLSLNHRFPGWSGLKTSDFAKADMRGQVQVVSAFGKYAGKSIQDLNATVHFEKGNAVLQELTGSIGSSPIRLSGSLSNVIPALFLSDVTIGIDAQLQTSSINLDEWLENADSELDEEHSIWIPNVEYRLAIQVGSFSMGSFTATNLSGVVEQRYPVLAAQNVSMQTCNGTAQGDVAFTESSGGTYLLKVSGDFTQIDATQLFASFDNFGQSTLKAEHVRGVVSGSAVYSGLFDRQFRSLLPSVQAQSTLHMTGVRLLEFEPLLAMAKYIDRDELAKVDFDEWHGDLLIQDETVVLPATEISSSVMDFTITGSHTFNNVIDYRISFPVKTVIKSNRTTQTPPELDEWYKIAETDRPDLHLKITGTVDEPIVKYDFKQAKKAFVADLKRQGRELKEIFREEFGSDSKGDTLSSEASPGTPDFILDWNPDGDTLKNP